MLSVNQIIFFKEDFTAFVAYKIFQQVCLKANLSGLMLELNLSNVVPPARVIAESLANN